MDKLAMWERMRRGDPQSAKSAANGLDAATAKDECDWIQVFYEDVLEPLLVSAPFSVVAGDAVS